MDVSPALKKMMAEITAERKGNEKEAKNFINGSEKQELLNFVTGMKYAMSEEQIRTNLQFIKDTLDKTNLSASYKIKGEDNINKPGATVFEFFLKPNGASDFMAFCKDFESRASKDAYEGKDPQYKALSENDDNFLIIDPESGRVKGYYNAKNPNGTEVIKNGQGVVTSVKGDGVKLTGMPENIKDVIKQDFTRYGTNLVKNFPNDKEGVGAKKFLEALKTIPGNQKNANLTLENAKELLSYIHTGANTQGKVDVRQL